MKHPRIGLALGSGAARGWSHIGVIDALAEAGIEPEIVCGTSIGSLVGAAYVAGQLPALRDWAMAATWREIIGLMDVRLSGGGVMDGRQIVTFLQGLGIAEPIESHAKKFAAVATDLVTGREIWLQSGPIHEAVRASVALPGILSPARIDGRWLVDGGLTNPVPVSVCRALGADMIIAVNLNGDLVARRFETHPEGAAELLQTPVPNESLDAMLRHLPQPLRQPAEQMIPRLLQKGPSTPGYFDVISNSINIMQDQITRTRLAGEPPHVMLIPRLSDIGLMEFNRARETIAEGRACVENALPMLQRYL